MKKTINIKGFSLIELLMIISIMILIGMITVPKLINFQREQSLKNTSENIISLLNKAKSDSQASLNSSNYGVHFENDYMVYFIGMTYTENNPDNQRVDFETGVTIQSGVGNSIIFPRLTGDVIGYGTVVIKLTALPTRTKTITVTKTGSISSN
jgi:type II secretory pathway pseudopilin PulG